jgi:hypothetical protein
VGEREDRIGRNEALFRALNERIEDISRFLDEETQEATFICECGRAECMERIRIPLDLYEHVRSDPTLFIVLPGHEEPDVATIVERHDGWNVVSKRSGEPAAIAIATDPRSDG